MSVRGAREPIRIPAGMRFMEVKTTRCEAGADGDCDWKDCPQSRDGEPDKSGRDCPLLSHARAFKPYPGISDACWVRDHERCRGCTHCPCHQAKAKEPK